MTVVRLTRVDEYWTKNGEQPKHCILKFQDFNRFANIKQFFHVSPPVDGFLLTTKFYKKLEPVASIVRINFQGVAISATFVSINEIIVRCTGRTKHTVMMRDKLCLVGYNVLALYEAGYCYGFIFSSLITGFFKLSSQAQQVLEAEEKKSPDHIITSMITSLSKT